MPKFFVNEAFQFKGQVIREGTILTVTESDVKREADRGYHEQKAAKNIERHLSGLITHCAPADDATAKQLSKALGKEVQGPEEEVDAEEETANAVEAIQAEFDKIGAAYDKRWNLSKLENELRKAKKLRG